MIEFLNSNRFYETVRVQRYKYLFNQHSAVVATAATRFVDITLENSQSKC